MKPSDPSDPLELQSGDSEDMDSCRFSTSVVGWSGLPVGEAGRSGDFGDWVDDMLKANVEVNVGDQGQVDIG